MSASIEAKQGALRRLLEVKAEQGRVPHAMIELFASALGAGVRTVYGWVELGRVPSGERVRHQASRADLDAYALHGGCATRAYAARRGDDLENISLRTFTRAINRALTDGQRRTLRTGEAGKRAHQVYLARKATYRNERWQADFKQLKLYVLPDGKPNARPRLPWVCVVQDEFDRGIRALGVTLADQPNEADVLDALYLAIRADSATEPFAGAPDIFVWDNGMQFLAEGVTEAVVGLGKVPAPTDPYAPHQKGKVERLNRTIGDEFLATLPWHGLGPRTASGQIVGPGTDLHASTAVMRESELVAHLREEVARYNYERPHSALGGSTPFQKFTSDPTPLDLRSDEELRFLLKRAKSPRVGKLGVQVNGEKYVAGALNGLVGREVEARFIPHDDRKVEVYLDGDHLCTALNQRDVTEADRDAVLAARRRDSRSTGNLLRRKSAAQRRALEELRADEPEPEVAALTDGADERPTGKRQGPAEGAPLLDLGDLNTVVSDTEKSKDN